MELPEPASTGESASSDHVSAVPSHLGAAEPADVERLRAARSAVEPWWSRAGAAAAVLLLAALGLLAVFLVNAGSAGTLSGSFILSTSGTVTLVGLAVAAALLALAIVLVLRRRRAGTTIGLAMGIVLTAVLGWVATSIVSFSLPNSTGLLVGLAIGAVAAAAATVVLALTNGRLLAVGRIEDRIGAREF